MSAAATTSRTGRDSGADRSARRASGRRAGPRPAHRPGPLRRLLDASLPYQLLTFALFALAWELYARARGGLLLPGFAETVRATVGLLGEGELWRALYVSNQALFLGFGIALAVGVPVGILLGRFRTLERYTDVYLNILLVTPMAALIPLLVMSTGIGLTSRVVLVAVFSIVMVIVNARAGVRQVDPSLIEMARSFGASERAVWTRVLLPGALPAVMTGVRLGVGRAVTGMVLVELLMVSDGLGGLILKYRGLLKAPPLYGTIAIVLAEALLLISVARWGERRLTRWARTAQGSGRARGARSARETGPEHPGQKSRSAQESRPAQESPVDRESRPAQESGPARGSRPRTADVSHSARSAQ